MRRISDNIQCGYFFRVFNLFLIKMDYNEKDKGLGKKKYQFSRLLFYYILFVFDYKNAFSTNKNS